jgi:hypothetical protein
MQKPSQHLVTLYTRTPLWQDRLATRLASVHGLCEATTVELRKEAN